MKIEIEIGIKSYDVLIGLTERTGYDTAELFKRALAAYDLLDECQRQGDLILIKHPDGEVERFDVVL